jgi:NIPSNAP
MSGNGTHLIATFNRYRFKGWSALAIALLSFASRSLIRARFMQPTEVRADNNRIFELMFYHTKPGRVAELESIFREVSKLQVKHNLKAVGYWVPNHDSAWKDTFVYLVAHPSLDEAKKNWNALHTDPAFLPYRRAAAPLIEQVNATYRVDEIFLRPTEYSAMK